MGQDAVPQGKPAKLLDSFTTILAGGSNSKGKRLDQQTPPYDKTKIAPVCGIFGGVFAAEHFAAFDIIRAFSLLAKIPRYGACGCAD